MAMTFVRLCKLPTWKTPCLLLPCQRPTPEIGLTYCQQCKSSSCSSRTETEQPLTEGHGPLPHGAPPQDTLRDMVGCLFQIIKTHVYWLGNLPWTLKYPVEDIKPLSTDPLFHCPMNRTKTTLFLMNTGFNYQPNSFLQYPGIDLSREAKKHDPPVVRTHPPLPLFKNRYHHPSLPLQRPCHWEPY